MVAGELTRDALGAGTGCWFWVEVLVLVVPCFLLFEGEGCLVCLGWESVDSSES